MLFLGVISSHRDMGIFLRNVLFYYQIQRLQRVHSTAAVGFLLVSERMII